ncbi:MAG TPA: response regulator [Roseiflexaceae bacterium]|nr:response regulator [Roseiflexaceae bacterium]
MASEPLVILLVEDNADHAELVIRNLEELPLDNRVFHVTNGQAALDYLLRREDYIDPARSPRPHIILLDLRLPRIDGLQVLQAIKTSEVLRQIPVIVLTTSDANQDVTRAYDCYANSYLVKPLGHEQFRKLIGDLGLYWLVQNRLPHLGRR